VRAAARTATVNGLGTSSSRDGQAGADPVGGQESRAPVIVLAPAYFGASTLLSLLDGRPDLACTAGTGLLSLCEQAMFTWHNADGRPSGQPSSLATAAIRAMAASIMTAILARNGKKRWCEIAAANPQAAETFLRLYPGTRFLCLYRSCPGVIRAALDTSPWGIIDPEFAPFTTRYPASTAAAVTAYWVTVTAPLLDFERAHPQACLRVRYEDLAQDQHDQQDHKAEEGRITSFLGLVGTAGQAIPGGRDEPRSAAPGAEPAVGLPVSLLPPALLAQANDLLQQLGYQPMTHEFDQTSAHPVRRS
jgi:hypothetical protein